MKINILGVLVDNLSPAEVLEKIKEFVASENQHYLVTPNPEFVMAAQKDAEFKNILNRADLAIPDGTGLLLVSRLLGSPIKQRVTGADLAWQIAGLAEQEKRSLYLLGGKTPGVAAKAAEKLREKFPRLKIAGAEEGGKITAEGRAEDETLVGRINAAKPDILFAAFGAPKQEKWIYHNLPKLFSVKLAAGVGGTFDFISGGVKRAPKIFRQLGLEWLWRLALEPWRWKRIWTAVFKFAWEALKFKIKGV